MKGVLPSQSLMARHRCGIRGIGGPLTRVCQCMGSNEEGVMECKGATSPLKSMQPFLEVPEIRPHLTDIYAIRNGWGNPLRLIVTGFVGTLPLR